MKKTILCLTMLTLLSSNIGFAASQSKNTGQGAASGINCSTDEFAWGFAIAGLAVLGIVVGVVVAGATESSNSH